MKGVIAFILFILFVSATADPEKFGAQVGSMVHAFNKAISQP